MLLGHPRYRLHGSRNGLLRIREQLRGWTHAGRIAAAPGPLYRSYLDIFVFHLETYLRFSQNNEEQRRRRPRGQGLRRARHGECL